MADNLKPYNPNKGFISFRLNPDAIIDELGNLIPFRQTIGLLDSEAPWAEVGKSAVREIPFLGSLLAGEYGDAIKEAVLFGMPIKAPAAKKQLSKFKPGTEFKDNGNNYVIAKEPGARKAKEYYLDEDGMNYSGQSYNLTTYNRLKDKPMSITELEKSIDNTNAMFEKAPSIEHKNPVSVANSDIGAPSEFMGEYGISKDYEQPYYNPIGRRIDAYDRMNTLYEEVSKAKPRKGEQVMLNVPTTEYVPMDNVVLYKPKTNEYRHPGFNDYMSVNSLDTPLRPVPDKNIFDYDKKLLQDEINQRNQRVDFEDDVIPYKSAKQYYEDYRDAYNAYIDALNGPFLEDIAFPNRSKFE